MISSIYRFGIKYLNEFGISYSPITLLETNNTNPKKNGFVKAVRGPNGGYSLAKNPSEISIADIMEGLDKSKSLVSCLYNSDICVISGHCSQQDMWSDVEQTLISKLQTITIKDLVDKDRTIINAAKLEN